MDFTKICRICLAQGELMSIFICNNDKKIMECTTILIDANDGLPTNICRGCCAKLHKFLDFRGQCERSDTLLREIQSKTVPDPEPANDAVEKVNNIAQSCSSENSCFVEDDEEIRCSATVEEASDGEEVLVVKMDMKKNKEVDPVEKSMEKLFTSSDSSLEEEEGSLDEIVEQDEESVDGDGPLEIVEEGSVDGEEGPLVIKEHADDKQTIKAEVPVTQIDVLSSDIFTINNLHLTSYRRRKRVPRPCSVLNCTDKTSARHRFPNPVSKPELYREWITACRDPALLDENPERVLSSKRMCHRHFSREYHWTNNRLTVNAIPTLYLERPLKKKQILIRDKSALTPYTPTELEQFGPKTKYKARKKKPKRCSVFNCQDKTSIRHRFPNPTSRTGMYKLWVQACKNPALEKLSPHRVYNMERVCHIHFSQEEYFENNRLSLLAVPVLHLPSTEPVGKPRLSKLRNQLNNLRNYKFRSFYRKPSSESEGFEDL